MPSSADSSGGATDSSPSDDDSSESYKNKPADEPAPPHKSAKKPKPATPLGHSAAPPVRPPPGAGRSAAKGKQQKRKLKARGRGHENPEDFELNLEALQGRWQHSSANLGMLVVRDAAVRFASGLAFTVVVQPDGVLEMAGWLASREQSTADQIVWTKGEFTCSWLFEGEADEQGTEEVDVRNIIQGKRQRGPVDYRALAQELKGEELFQARSPYSDASGSGSEAGPPRARKPRAAAPRAAPAAEAAAPREGSQPRAKNVDEALRLFKEWLLTTRSARHEEKLKQRGHLVTTLPVFFTGAGRGQIDKELSFYGVRTKHTERGTAVCVNAAARQSFAQRHADLWEALHRRRVQRFNMGQRLLAAGVSPEHRTAMLDHLFGADGSAGSSGASGSKDPAPPLPPPAAPPPKPKKKK